MQLERETWLRTLDYIQQENVFLKNNLAYIIKNGIDTPMPEQAEYFQNIFINKDTMIALLRHDILDLCSHAAGKERKNGDGPSTEQDKIRADMALIEREFRKLKNLFNMYQEQTLL